MSSKGTYVAVKFTNSSSNILKDFCDQYDIPNALSPDEFHTTIMYSRNELQDFDPIGKLKPENAIAAITGFDTFGENNNTLVALLRFEFAFERHHWLMNIHPEATWDYDSYIPHVTLSYDIAGYDLTRLPSDPGIFIVGSEEYSEELDLNWKSSLTSATT